MEPNQEKNGSFPEYEKFIKNLTTFMHEQKITQEKLGNDIGLSQSRVSDCLNYKGIKTFLLRDAYNIAIKYNLSIDELLGLPHRSISPKDTENNCIRELLKLLYDQYKSGKLRTSTITVKEDVNEWENKNDENSPFIQITKEQTYKCFYFPNFEEVDLPSQDNDFPLEFNNIPNNERLNDFLNKYFNIEYAKEFSKEIEDFEYNTTPR